MKQLLAILAALMIVFSPFSTHVMGQGINLGDDDEEDGMSDEEFREYILEIIQHIIDQYKSEGPNVDSASNPTVAEYILRKLELQKVTVHFQETSFNECLDFLRDITGLNIVLSPTAREIVEDVKINLRLRDIKLKSVIALMLEVSDELVYGVKYDVLYIGTKEDWSYSGQYLIVYSIHEIVYRPPNFPAPEIGLVDIIPWQNK